MKLHFLVILTILINLSWNSRAISSNLENPKNLGDYAEQEIKLIKSYDNLISSEKNEFIQSNLKKLNEILKNNYLNIELVNHILISLNSMENISEKTINTVKEHRDYILSQMTGINYFDSMFKIIERYEKAINNETDQSRKLKLLTLRNSIDVKSINFTTLENLNELKEYFRKHVQEFSIREYSKSLNSFGPEIRVLLIQLYESLNASQVNLEVLEIIEKLTRLLESENDLKKIELSQKAIEKSENIEEKSELKEIKTKKSKKVLKKVRKKLRLLRALQIHSLLISTHLHHKSITSPDSYLKDIRDISKVHSHQPLAAEMIRFYAAVAGLNMFNCIRTSETEICRDFLESLSDPIGHIGFAFFMLASQGTNKFLSKVPMARKITPLALSQAGLVAGFMAQNVFQGLWNHQAFQQYLNSNQIKDKEQREKFKKEQLQILWREVGQDTKFWKSFVPGVSGLVGAAILNQVTLSKAQKYAPKAYEKINKLFPNSKAIKTIGSVGSQYKTFSTGSKVGWSAVIKGGRILKINPLIAVGGYFIETSMFLTWDHIISGPIHSYWNRNEAAKNLVQSIDELKLSFPKNVKVKNEKLFKNKVDKISQNWDLFRDAVLSEAQMMNYRYQNYLLEINNKQSKVHHYYAWLKRGMDFKDKMYVSNVSSGGFPWHPYPSENAGVPMYLEADKYLESFFCGVNPKESVSKSSDILPFLDWIVKEDSTHYDEKSFYERVVKFSSKFEITPYKVIEKFGTCESDIDEINEASIFDSALDEVYCPVIYNGESFNLLKKGEIPTDRHKVISRVQCRLNQKKLRKTLVKYVSEQKVAEAHFEVEKILQSVRKTLIQKYEKLVKKHLLQSLLGLTVTENSYKELNIANPEKSLGDYYDIFKDIFFLRNSDIEITSKEIIDSRSVVSLNSTIDIKNYKKYSFKSSAFDSILQENLFWKELNQDYSDQKNLFDSKIKMNLEKGSFIELLIEFAKHPYNINPIRDAYSKIIESKTQNVDDQREITLLSKYLKNEEIISTYKEQSLLLSQIIQLEDYDDQSKKVMLDYVKFLIEDY